MKILQLSVHFSPNIGGVETHLWDLVTLLSKKNWQVFVLCYRPLSIETSWKIYEKYNRSEIFRIPWFSGLFYKFIPYPKLEFLYLFPGLFISTPIILFIKNPNVIHAHGIVAGFVAIFWGKIFNTKVIISTHSLYSFPKKGLYHRFAQLIFSSSNKVLCLSKKSYEEILSLGVNKNKVDMFTYWLDLNKFIRVEKAKDRFHWEEKFIVLFVGRLIAEKGIDILLQSVKSWDKNIELVIAGAGPKEAEILEQSSKNSRIHFLGKMDQNNLPALYSAVDVVIVPSIHEEGFGRVIMESLACGTPVIASKRGAIQEAMDETVGRLIDINSNNIKNAVEDFYNHPLKLASFYKNARKFAERRYSEKNASTIIQAYKD